MYSRQLFDNIFKVYKALIYLYYNNKTTHIN